MTERAKFYFSDDDDDEDDDDDDHEDDDEGEDHDVDDDENDHEDDDDDGEGEDQDDHDDGDGGVSISCFCFFWYTQFHLPFATSSPPKKQGVHTLFQHQRVLIFPFFPFKMALFWSGEEVSRGGASQGWCFFFFSMGRCEGTIQETSSF